MQEQRPDVVVVVRDFGIVGQLVCVAVSLALLCLLLFLFLRQWGRQPSNSRTPSNRDRPGLSRLALAPRGAAGDNGGMAADSRFTAKIGFRNSRKDGQPITIYVEPLAEDFTLSASEELEIVTRGNGLLPWFNVVEWGAETQVYLEDVNPTDFVVTQKGQQLRCGHNKHLREP